jgi:hypothetical protein
MMTSGPLIDRDRAPRTGRGPVLRGMGCGRSKQEHERLGWHYCDGWAAWITHALVPRALIIADDDDDGVNVTDELWGPFPILSTEAFNQQARRA